MKTPIDTATDNLLLALEQIRRQTDWREAARPLIRATLYAVKNGCELSVPQREERTSGQLGLL